MSTNSHSGNENFLAQLKAFIRNPIVQGIIALGGLIALVLDSNIVVKIIAILVLVGITTYFIVKIRPFIKLLLKWFTKKFFIGLVLGIISGAILLPTFFKPVFYNLLTLISPKVYILESFPRSGHILLDATSSVNIRFSKAIPWPYYSFIKVEEEFNYPIIISWDTAHQMLFISPNKLYPSYESGGTLNPRFGYGENYLFHISAPFLVETQDIEIISPNVIYHDSN